MPRRTFSSKSKKAASRLPLVAEILEARQLLTVDVLSLSPAPDAVFTNPATNLELTMSEDVEVGVGNLTIKSGATVLETIDVTSDAIQINGSVVTVNPSSDLPVGSRVTVEVDAGAFIGQSVPVFSEDFEGVELIPFIDETGGNEEGLDWSEELPAGWEKDNTDTPDGSPVEFFGWTIFDKNSWISTAGDQGRAEFTRGSGNVVVADGDEYDDGTDIDADLFNVFLTTPAISLDGVDAGAATLTFDSSFRPYPTQSGLVDVSFDDGDTWTNLLTLNDETVEGGTSSLTRANVREELPLDNPTGGTALIRFGLVDGGNDWWWAVDNVAVNVAGQGEASNATSWSFDTAPALSPVQGAVNVSPSANLEITFATDVKLSPGLGNVEIRRVDDDSLVESVAVSSDRVTAAGNQVTIDPVNDLDANVEYYVTIDDFSIWDTESVNVSGITIFAEDFESLDLQDSKLVGSGEDIDHYVAVITGVLDVKTAGTYTFGVNSDDGQRLAIDLDQNGLDLFSDELIYDDTTHAAEVRLTTCAFLPGVTSCEENGDPGFDLDVGEYEFEFWYFEATGGSSGEFFYGPGDLEAFAPGAFAIVGDDSLGIGVTEAGITATIYRSAVEDETLDTITSFERAELLVEGEIASLEGFPMSGPIPTADVWNTGSGGQFSGDHPLPGLPEPELDPDWTNVGPEGWTTEEDIPAGGAPEFEGWTFMNKDFWITQQGDQDRATFTKGEGTLAVMDPDATDDFVDVDPDLIQDAYLITKEISFSGVSPNSMTLEFDSSFRPYPTMVGTVDVSFDDGDTWSNLLTLNDDTVEGGTSSLSRADFREVLPLDNPAEGSVKVRWGIDDAGNDWWWAIDNIRITSPFSGNPLPGITAGQWSFSTGGGGPVDGCLLPCPEDIDGDGEVGFSDFLLLSGNFGLNVEAGTGGDIDGNGVVEFADFLSLSAQFGKQVVSPPPTAPAASAATTDLVFAGVTDDADQEDEDDLFGLLD